MLYMSTGMHLTGEQLGALTASCSSASVVTFPSTAAQLSWLIAGGHEASLLDSIFPPPPECLCQPVDHMEMMADCGKQ